MFGDNEQHRICSACVAKDGKRKVPTADTGGRGQSNRPKVTNGGSKKSQPSRKGPRAQPDLYAKLEMLKLMDAKVTHEQKADRCRASGDLCIGDRFPQKSKRNICTREPQRPHRWRTAA
ncbi:unnamed protein product [Ectocarpus sp. CCAP 1310/34]|nr:unnamed protein product [Ectocarpus sp. CCAP 1310/34]